MLIIDKHKSLVGNLTGVYLNPEQNPVYQISSPIDETLLAELPYSTNEDYQNAISDAQKAFLEWRNIPAPKRGEFVGAIGEAVKKQKKELALLLTSEMGKTLREAEGEVQEVIDICMYCIGLSRKLYGYTMPSERPNHRIMEQYHPLGVVGIISAFNFPIAVWAWNAMIAWTCGNVCIWKPSEKTPLIALAAQKIVQDVIQEFNYPTEISSIVLGDSKIGKLIAEDKNIVLVSATGSIEMGKSVAQVVAARLGKSILELGGNNAIIVTPNADINKVIPAVVFGAVGTAGQRCTTVRRLIVHESCLEEVTNRLEKAYQSLKIGNPLDNKIHVGPLIDHEAVVNFEGAISEALKEGGKLIIGGKKISDRYVNPTILLMNKDSRILQKETFAPILYIVTYKNNLAEAIDIQNSVNQGLSSAIFSENMVEIEEFLTNSGSDCGIANVNIGTSGAEIGGAFGGEKETGGGRESGSDSWKAYMRRQTVTINYGKDLPLAQGIKFELN